MREILIEKGLLKRTVGQLDANWIKVVIHDSCFADSSLIYEIFTSELKSIHTKRCPKFQLKLTVMSIFLNLGR